MTSPSIASPPSKATFDDVDARAIDTIRFLAADAVERAASGHPGMPMGTAPMAYVLWRHHLRHDPQAPRWPNRDRFVLSAGHGSMLLYALLHLSGYEDMTMEQLKNFRQWDSITAGHPEGFLSPAIETTTGPLGQGFGNAVGMAMAEKFMAARFNRPGFEVVDHRTYGICSDGDMMEGISHEAASLAGHLGLGKLIFLYDDNEISIDGSTSLSFSEDVEHRFEAYDWHVQHVDDGEDVEAVDGALRAAKAETERPSLIGVETIIGHGAPNQQGTADAHGSALGEEELARAKRNLDWPEDERFLVPDEVQRHMRDQAEEQGRKERSEWRDLMDRYADEHPEEAAQLRQWNAGEFEGDWEDALPTFEAGEAMATRKASGAVLDALGPEMPHLIGGSADLTPSNKTDIEGRENFQKDTPEGAYLRFGVREHAMAAASNGIAVHEGLRPYCATFLIFSDYMRPALRLSALMGQPVVFVFTHDSIGLGEDGPTHQPVEHLMALRAIPNLTLIRPADANETVEAWRAALCRTDGPTALALTRQGLPTFDRTELASAEGARRGGYVLRDAPSGEPEIILIGTGSEVQHALSAARTLADGGTQARVVSMPSWELFEAQDEAYREEVLPPEVTRRVSVEAGATTGWERYVGLEGRVIGIDRFGASAPGETVMQKLGFTAENVVENARELLR
jgi:transketolase